MAEIALENLSHSYLPQPRADDDWALKDIDLVWRDGGSYALLGPSGCGKSTLLNIISGLLAPSAGKVFFDGEEVSALSPVGRNIAQVFQFPVVYDTMTVFQNLAFPLRNRGMAEKAVSARVHEVAEMLELSPMLHRRAHALGADNKQKISLGRGLVRSDVNAIMLDEPLTVIDPHLKWQLRSQLKRLHRRFGFTMIYVTHDQTEALTLADQIVVLHDGKVVQSGSPEALFDRPEHTFVGHFIGSPGMNRFPASVRRGVARIGELEIPVDADLSAIGSDSDIGNAPAAAVEIGVRPEHIRLCDDGFAVRIRRVHDVGRYRIAEAQLHDTRFKIYLPDERARVTPGAEARARFDRAHTHLYLDGWLYSAPAPAPPANG